MQPLPYQPFLCALSEHLGATFSDQLKALLNGAGATDLLRIRIDVCSPEAYKLPEGCENLGSVVVSIVLDVESESIGVLTSKGFIDIASGRRVSRPELTPALEFDDEVSWHTQTVDGMLIDGYDVWDIRIILLCLVTL